MELDTVIYDINEPENIIFSKVYRKTNSTLSLLHAKTLKVNLIEGENRIEFNCIVSHQRKAERIYVVDERRHNYIYIGWEGENPNI